MSAITPPATALYEIFYGTKHADDDELEHDIKQMDASQRAAQIANEKPGYYTMSSIYVLAFEKMLMTVFESEAHLLTEKEFAILDAVSKLHYNARYCLVRLILRKTNTWHTLASIQKFKQEVGEEGLQLAMEALCTPIKDLLAVKEEPAAADIGVPKAEIIDLTADSDNEDMKPIINDAEAGPSRDWDIKPSLDGLLNSSNTAPYEPNFDFFMEDESCMDLSEALHKLNVDQLKDLIKVTKTKPEKLTKLYMISELLEYASTQTHLGFVATGKAGRNTKFSNDHLRQTILPFKTIKGKSSPETQERRLLHMALEKLGKTFRVNIDLYWLIARINVIYDRCTEYPKSLLVPSLLTSFKKRTYPEYKYTRDSTIWESREEFMDYFEALRLEAAIEHELEPPPPGRPNTKTPASVQGNRNKFVTPVPPPSDRNLSVPLRTSMSGASSKRLTESPAVCKQEEDLQAAEGMGDGEEQPEEPIKMQTARRVKKVSDEIVLPKWRELVAYKQERDMKERTPGLERFEPGFVYTRIFSKVIRALATLKLYEEEVAVLEALLDQQFWRRGKRAKWYERRAVLQMNYLCKVEDSEGKKTDMAVLRQALVGVLEALEDDDTGLVWRPGFVRRLRRLEKRLKVPEEDRCLSVGELRTANIVEFSAERLLKTSKSLKLDTNGRPINGNKGIGYKLHTYFFPPAPNAAAEGGTAPDKENKPANPSDNWKWKGKSIWRGVNGEELNVERRALQYYETLGYKGFHSESRILTTIFALLFWDIIFADVPGAFETPHQTAPLDMAEDSFYRARKKSIERRLVEITQKGGAREILKQHDDLYREKKTWCVGVRWDICEKQDLLEIVECLGGHSLSTICRLFCEDYAGRSSGVPDLIVWNAAKGQCKFVEVKGPGDTASENQKLWFDSLLGASADVEVCKVLDKDKPVPTTRSAKAKKTGTWPSTAKKSKGKGKGKARVGDSDLEMDSDCHDHADQPDDEAWGSSPILGKRRRRPPDENDDRLPVFNSSATPPTLPSVPLARRSSHIEAVLPAPKRRKIASVSPS